MKVASEEKREEMKETPQCGSAVWRAGMTVDVVLFPLDTRRRACRARGVHQGGGISGIYKGISAAATGSALVQLCSSAHMRR